MDSKPTVHTRVDSTEEDDRPGKTGPRPGIYQGAGDDEDFDW